MRRQGWGLVWAGASVVAGLVWRLGPLHLPWFAYKYGGSGLYAAMIYWLVVAAAPRLRVGWVAVWALGLAFAVEGFKLVPSAGLDAFRMTLAGRLMLGRVFSGGALVGYGIGVLVVAGVDWVWCGLNAGPSTASAGESGGLRSG